MDVSALSSAGKALSLLDCFRGQVHSLGVTEVAAINNMPKATAFRMLAHLESSGLLERDGRKYRPSWQLWELAQGSVRFRPDGPRSLAVPLMTNLHGLTNAVVHLGVRRGDEVLVVEKIYGLDSVSTPSRPGSRFADQHNRHGQSVVGRDRGTRYAGSPSP